MFSNTAKYAIRALLYVAIKDKENRKIGIKELAKELDLPGFFLGKIMQTLVKQKILVSFKGPNGGFAYNIDPHDLTLLKVVEIFDGLDVFDTCLLGFRICQDDPELKKVCPLSQDVDVCVQRLRDYLESKTIGGIADKLNDVKDFILL